MPRTTATFSVSLPPEMAAELERVRKHEHRTRSELVREALRSYIRDAAVRDLKRRIAVLPEEEPTRDELEAITAAGNELHKRGRRTLAHRRHELRRPSRQSSAKKR